MSVHWSSELMKWEYRELQATAMSVDWSGNNVLLAGRRCLALKHINLDDENSEIIKKYPRQSKYDAAGAEWCQTQQGQRLCAISSNQRVDVYHWRNGDLTCTNSLRGHTRVVSDTHWHRQDHNLLATCSIDTFTHIWDLRDTRKPALSLCAVAGASQVQWNKVAGHILATAHDGDIKIWDKRKGSSPIHYISAHLCKIHGVDWSPHHEYQLVTSSHDGNIKYFDINNGRRPESTITTNFPVWRAIYTPFGSGLLTIGVGWGGVPRGEQAGVVGIWVGGALTHRLVGHTDMVLQMVWRPNTSPSNFQLITWARDQSLRVWSMHPTLMKMCNHYLPDESDGEDDTLSETTSNTSATDSANDNSETGQEIQMVKLSSQKPSRSLDEEFESVRDMANIVVTDMSMDARTCTIRTERNGYIANLQVTFPQPSSDMVIPKFSWLAGTTVDSGTTIKILQSINLTAHQKIKVGQPCLLHCLKTLGACIDQIPVKSKEDSDSIKSGNTRSQSDCESAGDACIPFPRTCGAKWCGVSTLVVFNRPPNARRLSLKQDSGTPRSMSSLSMIPGLFGSGYGSISPHATTTPSPTNSSGFSQLYLRNQSHSITAFYFQDRWKAQSRRTGSVLSRSRSSTSGQNVPRVVLYTASHLFPCQRQLAENYIIKKNSPVEMSEHNAAIAAKEGNADLTRAWLLSSRTGLLLQERTAKDKNRKRPVNIMFETSEDNISWATHPLCSQLIQSLIGHYAKVSDIQMAAMLSSTFGVFSDNSSSNSSSTETTLSSDNNGGLSPYTTLNQLAEMNIDGWAVPFVKPHRSNSWSNPAIDTGNVYSDIINYSKGDSLSTCVDSSVVHLYSGFKRAYADILHRWQLLHVRAQIMKQVVRKYDKTPIKHVGIELVSECAKCRSIIQQVCCKKCSNIALTCVICNIGVRGLANACLVCGHGGHADHMAQWFAQYDICPTGCGCKCLAETNSVWKNSNFV